MPAEQTAFDFSPSPPPAEIGEVELVLNYLSNNPGFHFRSVIATATGLTERAVRKVAEKNRHLILSGPGSPGYCHLYHATPEQINRYTSTAISQGREMTRGAIRTRRAAHALIARGIIR